MRNSGLLRPSSPGVNGHSPVQTAAALLQRGGQERDDQACDLRAAWRSLTDDANARGCTGALHHLNIADLHCRQLENGQPGLAHLPDYFVDRAREKMWMAIQQLKEAD